MAIAATPATPDLLRRVVRLQVLTIAWMTVEAVVALGAAWTARSPALLGFGGDSAIELFSAIIVLWRFRSKSNSADAEKLAARVAGGLLFIVAAFVIVSSALSLLGYREPRPSFAGIVLLIVAAIGMPWLASQKRKLATQISSAVLECRRSRIGPLWLLVTGSFGRTVGKRHLSRAVGRPHRGLSSCAAHREGRMGSRPRFATLL